MAMKVSCYGIPWNGSWRKVAVWLEISQMNRLSIEWHTLIPAQPSSKWNNLDMEFVKSVLLLCAELCCAKKINPGKKIPITTGLVIKTEVLCWNLIRGKQQGLNPAALGSSVKCCSAGPWLLMGRTGVQQGFQHSVSPLVCGGFSWQDGDGKAGPGEGIWAGTS